MENKQLPIWKDAPEWANWRAVDANGDLFYYEKEPFHGNDEWYVRVVESKSEFAGTFDVVDWQNSLECRPENTALTPEELTQMCGPNYELWEYLHDELGVIALDSQLGDIIEIVRKIEQKEKSNNEKGN